MCQVFLESELRWGLTIGFGSLESLTPSTRAISVRRRERKPDWSGFKRNGRRENREQEEFCYSTGMTPNPR